MRYLISGGDALFWLFILFMFHDRIQASEIRPLVVSLGVDIWSCLVEWALGSLFAVTQTRWVVDQMNAVWGSVLSPLY